MSVDEIEWQAAVNLLREAQEEINSLDMVAKGSYWYGNEIANRIGEFLKTYAGSMP